MRPGGIRSPTLAVMSARRWHAVSVRRPYVAAVLVVVLALASATGVPAGASGHAPGGWRQKVAAAVLHDTEAGRSASFVVMMASQADVGAAASLPTKAAKGRFVFDRSEERRVGKEWRARGSTEDEEKD